MTIFEQNYIQFNFDHNVFFTKVSPPKNNPSTPASEAEKSAFYYYKKYRNKKILLCMSGGLDSEVMAESFLKAGVPFSASIWKYKKDFNAYDIKSAIRFCEENGIDYDIEECDLELFYGNHLHFHYGIKYLCDSPQVTVHLYFLEKLLRKTSVAVFLPWQPPSFYYDSMANPVVSVRIMVHFRYLAYARFFHLNQSLGSPYFLICCSSLFYSFLKLPIVKFIINQNLDIHKVGIYKLKTIMYKQGGFTSKPKSGKFTGFDKIKTVLKTKYGMDYDTAFRYPLEYFMSSPKQRELHLYPIWER